MNGITEDLYNKVLRIKDNLNRNVGSIREKQMAVKELLIYTNND